MFWPSLYAIQELQEWHKPDFQLKIKEKKTKTDDSGQEIREIRRIFDINNL